MRNPTRRNRNIGTAKQGAGQHNRLTIPSAGTGSKHFYERLEPYEKTEKIIHGHTFIFITEKHHPSSPHACTVNDIARILSYLPPADYGDLKFIVLRQPKRKEEIISHVWGRLIYSYEFENEYYPAVILETANYRKPFKWKRNLDPDDQQELARLREDGHVFVEDKRSFTTMLESAAVRNTQLYRTLLHELGHYVHYLTLVQPFAEDAHEEAGDKREDNYFRLPKDTKEKFAHQYADQWRAKLLLAQLIPFERME
ncbi:hypothetical protein [Chitinophaga arvensicola]|uniref:Uncharacterized protein n=1 Tax=Chitinophaga arvensicola TaxID=29529 RepID=A0A1I0S7F5_9BACT|nr:hypothetical protein [Chitinophaga arvensicola]SEW51685.1 hypothetical protein SAMN04488122_4441 [Chitinophaga arvensicola]